MSRLSKEVVVCCHRCIVLLFVLSISCFDLSRCGGRETRSTVVEDATSEYMKQTRWTKADLTYDVIGNVASRNQTSKSAVEKAVREAFDDWERNSCFRFKRLPSSSSLLSQADVKVVFTNDRLMNNGAVNSTPNHFYHRNCTKRFRRNIAHAFFRTNRKFAAQIHINNEILWIESRPIAGSISLRSIVAHEIGHVLGLLHSSDETGSIMYDYVYTNQVKRVGRSDRVELERIYRDLCVSLTRQPPQRSQRPQRLRVYSSSLSSSNSKLT